MKRVCIQLQAEQRQTLLSVASSGQPRLAVRARVILLTEEGQTALAIAKSLGMTVRTVYKWRRRFAATGVSGLRDLARPGQPRRLPRQQRAEIVDLTLHALPPQGQRWTIRSVARRLGVTQHQVRQVWLEAKLRPHAGRGNVVDERQVDGAGIVLIGLLLSPRCNVVAFRLSRSGGASPRLRRGAPRGRYPALRALAQSFSQAAPGSDRSDGLEELPAFVAQLEDARGASGVQLVFASEQARARAGALAPAYRSSAKSCLSVWLDGLQLWLEQHDGSESQAVAISELQRALDRQQGSARGKLARFAWVHAPVARPLGTRAADLHFAQVSR